MWPSHLFISNSKPKLCLDRRKKREVPSNDDLLYNPEEDDVNEDWVAEQLRGSVRSACDHTFSMVY